eukprot:SAG22_NODE_48_length_24654_cov_4.406394_26_plen_123_part_00
MCLSFLRAAAALDFCTTMLIVVVWSATVADCTIAWSDPWCSYEQPGTPAGLANSSITTQIIADIAASVAARKAVNASFELATCGWAVGPSDAPALLDKVLSFAAPSPFLLNTAASEESVAAN